MYTTDKEAIRSNMIRIYELIAANSPLASVVKSSTFVRMDSEVNHPMFNRVLDYKVSKDIDPAEEMKSIMESYESRGVLGFWLTYSHDSDPAIAEALAANGLVKRGAMSGMSLSLANWSYQSPEISGLEIRLAQSERDFEDFKEVFSGGFGVSDLCYQLFVGDSRHEPSFRFHVAYVNALPACSVMTYLDGDVRASMPSQLWSSAAEWGSAEQRSPTPCARRRPWAPSSRSFKPVRWAKACIKNLVTKKNCSLTSIHVN